MRQTPEINLRTWLFTLWVMILVMPACSSELEQTNTEPSQFPLPTSTTLETQDNATATFEAVVQPEPILTSTTQPTVVPTAAATLSPIPQPTSPPSTNSELAHPKLLFGEGEVEQFREDINEVGSLRQKRFASIEKYLAADESFSLLASSFFVVLTGDTDQLNKARAFLQEQVAQDCWDPNGLTCQRDRDAAERLGQMSLAYDWLYPELSEAEREQLKNRIATEVCRYYEAFTYGKNAWGWNNWWMETYTQNHFHTATGGMVLGALAINNDNPPTCQVSNAAGQHSTVTNQAIIDFGLQKMERNYLVFNRIADGSYPEGDSYTTTYGEIYLDALWAVQRLVPTAQNLLDEQRLKAVPLFYLYSAAPGQVWKSLTNHGDYLTSSRENYWFPKHLRLAARVHQNPLSAWLADEYFYDKDGATSSVSPKSYVAATSFVYDFIFLEANLQPQSPADLKLDLSYHASDWEGVFARSDWSDKAVAVALKVGPPGGHSVYNLARSNYQLDQWVGGGQEPAEFSLNAGHMHADANGLYLYANNTFLLPEMLGYSSEVLNSPWGRYTSSHNTILVNDDQGRMRGQIQGDAEGGTSLGYQASRAGSEEFWNIETPQSEVGILEHASTQGYDYSLGQATSAYWPELGLKRFHRHALFVRDPGYVFVVDDLDATAEKTYDWMGHSTGTVSQEGTWLKVQADNEQRLGIAVVAPSSFSLAQPLNEWAGINLQDQYVFKYVSEKRAMYEWKIRQHCQRCRFINVLYPTDEQHWSQKPTITKLADTDQMAAVQIDFDAENRTDTLAISFTPGQSLTAGNLTFDGRVAGLEMVGSQLLRTFLVGGASLKMEGVELVQDLPSSSFLESLYGDKDLISFIEIQYKGDTLLLRSPDPTGVTLFAPDITTVLWQRVEENNIVITRDVSFTRNGDHITLTGFN